MPGTRHYGSSTVAKTLGISLRQLYYWVDVLHVVSPQLRPFGHRRFRRFTVNDLQRLKAVQRLLKQGYTLQAAIRIAKHR